MTKKSCKKGYYYCYASKKCKKIPMGYVVGMGGWLRKEKEEDETEGKKKNGNGANGDGSGSGDSNGGSDGGGVSEGWSAKYKKSINCDNPKGFSQRAHCQGKKKVTEGKEGDHEVSMAKSQLKKSAENIAKLRKVLKKKTDKDNLPAWVQAKITDTEHNTDAAAGYMEEGKRDGKSAKDKGYSLRDWFRGGGWVQAGGKYDGKPCAKQPGQKTKPFCRDADDRANMSKKERSRRAAKKRREDPNPNRKGKAKMVTDNYSNWREDLKQLDEFIGGQPGDGYIGHPRLGIKNPISPPKKETKIAPKNKGLAGRLGNRAAEIERMLKNSYESENQVIEGRYSGGGGLRPSDRIKMLDGSLKSLKDIDAKLKEKETKKEEVQMEGKKDACYHKVKSRYSVWPSAYASGALVKCRKVGAKNWGNKTKKEDFSNWREDMLLEGLEDKLRKMSPEQIEDLIKANKGAEEKIRATLKNMRTPKSQGPGAQLPNIPKQPASTSNVTPRETYQRGGGQGRETYVKRRTVTRADVKGGTEAAKRAASGQGRYKPGVGVTPDFKLDPKFKTSSSRGMGSKVRFRGRGGKLGLAIGAATLAAPYVVGAIKKAFNKEDYEFSNWRDDFQATEYESVDIIKTEPLKPTDGIGSRMLDEAKKCWKGYKKVGTQKLFGKTYNRCVKKEEVEVQEGVASALKLAKPISKRVVAALLGAGVLKSKKKMTIDDFPGFEMDDDMENQLKALDKAKKDGAFDEKQPKGKNPKRGKDLLDRLSRQMPTDDVAEDWQKSNRNDGVDGMSQKSVDAYRRENPGSKLKTAVTGKVKKGSKDAKRRKSFCSRSKGQKDMHNIDCTKTPDKKICKARKRWRC